MRWQRPARIVIAIFVVGFVAFLLTTLRREAETPAQPPPAPDRVIPESKTANLDGCNQISAAGGRRIFSLECGQHFVLPDGRQKLMQGVSVSLPRGDREFLLASDEAEIKPKEGGLESAVFTGDVRITTEAGLRVESGSASYDEAEGMVRIPGPVTFSKGRLRGSGVGATYDRNREVLWVENSARLEVAADPASGEQRMQASADRIGIARAEHYLKLQGNGVILSEGRTIQASDIAILLTEDDERVRGLELRGHSRISGGAGGPQSMSARDIDLAYADDGRTLQRAVLVENAALHMAPANGSGGKRIAGHSIELAFGPDGSTVTGLAARGDVQLDLPPEKTAPGRQIRAAALDAHGQPAAGLDSATFTGGVNYRESRGGRGQNASLRTARSDTLVLQTAPGLGAIREADFRGNVTFAEGSDLEAEAAQAIYQIERDRLTLSPGDGYPGPPARVTDGRVSISARTIDMTVSTRELSADTRVRSTMLPQKPAANGSSTRRLPGMLQEDAPVNVSSNRLKYLGSSASATYAGSAVLWQGGTQIKGDTIVVDDRKGNLTVTGNATTRYFVDEEDRKTGATRRVETLGSAEIFAYDDSKRLAVYTTRARLIGAQGDVTADKIELFMKPGENELERAEAYGSVVVREGQRVGRGTHLTYTAATDEYLMVGTPVEIIEERKGGGCVRTIGATARFNRTSEQAAVEGEGAIPAEQKSIPCPARGGR